MSDNSLDTIFAPASGHGRAAVCVIRISGNKTRFVLETIFSKLPTERRASLRHIIDPATGETLDQCLVLWMPGPASFTGEDQAELQIHGGIAVRQAVLKCLSAIEGCRAAKPGEFTRRAFLNGRMDLTAVEGLADLIDAETEAQRRQALRQMEGRVGEIIELWREDLLTALALMEAALDFSDEGDVADGQLEAQSMELIQRVRHAVDAELMNRTGERLREGLTIVLAGAPNAGKSTLLNALARREVAIVSPIAGTTRDVIETRLDLGGLPAVLVDTAGLRDSDDPIEQEGVARARKRAEDADIVLWLVAPGDNAENPPEGREIIRVATKNDLEHSSVTSDYSISATTGSGLSELIEGLEQRASRMMIGEDAIITRERHRKAMQDISECLERAVTLLQTNGLPELATEEIRLATRACGVMTGRIDVEDVLDRLFSSFCIGK
ncbi:tRNA uridine-5-carboxymethylaminomethyl(34) synthesis GTPase MnmE [Microvirga sp. W0021]|uniref:tRNA modification GTPase MnmE n=1 Tax=Hohaiivirga grylli TaxID=3133970 RepID=A0ABV0BH44_9HYPH